MNVIPFIMISTTAYTSTTQIALIVRATASEEKEIEKLISFNCKKRKSVQGKEGRGLTLMETCSGCSGE